MPKFHFDLHDGEEFVDNDGVELLDLTAAELHAQIVLKAMIGWSGADWGDGHFVVVRDSAGDKLLEATAHLEIKRLMQ